MPEERAEYDREIEHEPGTWGAKSDVPCENCEDGYYRRVLGLREDTEYVGGQHFSCPNCGDGTYLAVEYQEPDPDAWKDSEASRDEHRFCCGECGANFSVDWDVPSTLKFCPFCGDDAVNRNMGVRELGESRTDSSREPGLNANRAANSSDSRAETSGEQR